MPFLVVEPSRMQRRRDWLALSINLLDQLRRLLRKWFGMQLRTSKGNLL